MSELHNRLAHLVNYTSQLIFVSGDSVAEQQRVLNSFLASQQEDTDISYFTASETQTASDYRAIICRQLANHVVGSFVRPLHLLLGNEAQQSDSGLSQETGPYLVCITQAEYLPESFLQELWDWVLHIQQMSDGVHLNIILFGESKWAQTSQLWLPNKNSYKPVLLSSQTIDPVGFDVNALEALMADKRSWLGLSNQPLVANKWFITSVLTAFFVVFVGLMVWQYPQQIQDILNNQLTTTAVTVSNEQAPKAVQQNGSSALTETNSITTKTKSHVDTKNAYSQLEVIEKEIGPEIPTLALHSTSSKTSKPINPQNTFIDNMRSNNSVASDTSDTKVSVTESILVGNFSTLANIESPKSGDFQVPDIISVEQLDAQFAIQKPLRIEQLAMISQSATSNIQLDTTVKSTIASLDSQELALIDTPAIDYKFDETTLLALSKDAVVLQLSGIQDEVVLQNYLNVKNLRTKTWVYQTRRYGGPWYVVVYKQSFESIDNALLHLSGLADEFKESQPFAKSINQVQQEILLR